MSVQPLRAKTDVSRVRVFESNRHPALRHLSRLKPRLSIEPVQTQLGSHLDPCDAAFDPVLTHDCPNFVSICVIVAQALGRGFRDTLYNLIYVLPLAAIVLVFVRTMGARRLGEREGRLLKLLSGLMMLGLGLCLVLAPQALGDPLVALALLAAALGLTGLAAWRGR